MTSSATMRNSQYFDLRLTWPTVLFFFVVFFLFDGHTVFRDVQEGLTLEQSTIRVAEGGIARRISLLMLFGFGMITLMRKGPKSIQVQGFLGWVILFFLVLAFSSLAWANDMGLTFRRLMVLSMFSLAALAVARHFSIQNMALLLLSITAGYLFLGLASEITLGTFRPLTPAYRFIGTLHPNHQGINCALLFFSAVFLGKNTIRQQGLFLAIALVALVFLILTKSRTSFASVIISLLAYWSLVLPLSRKWVFFLSASITFCLLFLLFGDKIFSTFQQGVLLGRDNDSDSTSSLMGRIPLWKECLEYASRRPLLGYGYGSFWTRSRILEISAEQGWGTTEAHSGYIELALGLGIIGMITYILILVVGIRRAFVYHRMSVNKGYDLLGLLLIFSGMEGLLESVAVLPSLMTFFSMVAFARLGFHAYVERG